MQEVIGVIIGGTLGHALCTSLAVLGGRCISQHISIKTGVTRHPVISTALCATVVHNDMHTHI